LVGRLYKYFFPSGNYTLVESLDELFELERMAVAKGIVPEEATPNEPQSVPYSKALEMSESWAEFIVLVGDRAPQLKLLRFMKERGPQPTTLKEMAQAIGVETTSVAGGTVSGIRKNSKKVGWDNDAVLMRLKDGNYVAGPVLLTNTVPARTRWERINEAEDDVKD
jgi:hypothetical protein